MARNKIINAFNQKKIPKNKLSNAGYDNPRENIDPHIKTKVIDTKEIVQDGVGYDLSSLGGTVEGTAVLSTGEGGGTKFLREDGDDSCSWQTPAGAGDVTAAVNLTANTIVQGDDGVKGVKTSTATVAQIATNVTHVAGDGSDHADVATNTAASHAQAHNVASHSDTTITGAETETLSDGSDADALHAHATNDTHVAGDGSDHADVATNTAASHAEAHNAASHSDITATGAQIDAAHAHVSADGSSHADVVTNSAHTAGDGSDHADVAANTTHAADSTQAHSDYLKNDAADAGVGLTLSGDNEAADTYYVPNILYNTDDTPPAANTVPRGTLYIQYTA